jgi:hypothetical protein
MKNKKTIVAIIVLALIAIIPFILAQSFMFSPNPLGTIFNASEHIQFLYDFNVSYTNGTAMNESLVNYSMSLTTRSIILLNSSMGILAYTPVSGDIGKEGDIIYITAANKSNSFQDFETTSISFNVSNVNDPPNITGYSPENLTQLVNEGSSIYFTINATDPDIQFGDSINYSWYLDSVLQENESNWTYSPGYCVAGEHNITVVVTDWAGGLTDYVYWNVTVNNSNRPPVQNRTIENITWLENTNLIDNLTLSNYFYDNDTLECGGTGNADTITYSTNFTITELSNINVTINETTSNVSFYPSAYFARNLSIQFIANDSYSEAYSNDVWLILININDPPSLEPIGNQIAAVNVTFTKILNASDSDLPYGDTLTWWTNSTLFTITKLNATHAMINFTPTEGQIGNYSIFVSVNDSFNRNATEIFNFTIRNNTAPVLDFIGWLNATEDSLFLYYVTAYDADNDSLTFTTNSTLFTLSTIPDNESAVKIEFMPTNEQVGNYTFRITVTDPSGARDYEDFNFTVINFNDAPVLNNIFTPKIVKINHTLSFNITASDDDLIWGDSLTYWTNSTLFNITKISDTKGFINFTATDADYGNHTIVMGVNDTGNLNDTKTFILMVVNSSTPLLNFIENQNATEDVPFSLIISATDQDFDPVTIYLNIATLAITPVNFTMLDSTSGMLNFTAEQYDLGTYAIRAYVNDTDGHVSYQDFNLTVSFTDDPPYFVNAVNLTATQNTTFLWNITAFDEEISLYGAVQNLTFSTNTTLFNLSYSNATAALINYTPGEYDVGNYSISFTVSDGLHNDTVVILFTVLNFDDPPQIVRYYPSQFTFSIMENTSIKFNATATDPDITFGDNITFAWYLDGVNQTANLETLSSNSTHYSRAWDYLIDFCQAGNHTVKLVVSDIAGNKTANLTWDVTVNNINRLPTFGLKVHTTAADFSSGTNLNTSTTNFSGNVTLAMNESGYFMPYGVYTSPNFDFGDRFRYSSDINITHVLYLYWNASIPGNTALNISYRTGDGSTYTPWSDNFSTSPQIVSPKAIRYLQYRAYFYTNDSNKTPSLEEVRVTYTIKNITINQNTRYTEILNLNDFFSDEDMINCTGANRDNLTYNVSGNSSLKLLWETHSKITLLEHTSFYGTELITFWAYDGINITHSDNLSITVLESSGQTLTPQVVVVTVSSGGTSTVTQTQTRIVIKNITQPVYLEIIVPKPITIYRNETVIVPILLRNTQNFTLEGISLQALVNNSAMSLSFVQNKFDKIDPGKEVQTMLIMQAYKSMASYEVVVSANVTSPSYQDSASFYVNSIELGTKNASQLDTRITFTRDLLAENPECLELNENLLEAQDAIRNNDLNKANLLIEQVINDCKYLISVKGTPPEKPAKISLFTWLRDKLKSPYAIGGIILFVLILLSIIAYRMLAGKMETDKDMKIKEEHEIEKILEKK